MLCYLLKMNGRDICANMVLVGNELRCVIEAMLCGKTMTSIVFICVQIPHY